ncbi:MAG TPA: isocitrate lyase/PEP mutase family protein [Trebonia sp.]|nr:isocitrate lyase/PEP mutase family protein [Trebonia sp.]
MASNQPSPPPAETAPASPARRLRRLIEEGEMVVAPGIFDGISAHLVRRMGFLAGYLTGAGVAAAGFGLPDIGLVGLSEMVDRASMVTGVLGEVPLIADADTGYGPPPSVARTVRAYERAGVAAIQLEDQAFPKRCGHLPGKELVSVDEYLGKLGAALDARTDALIIARTDARAVLGLDAAIERGHAYAAAGADVIFVEAPRTVEEMTVIAREITAPKLINVVAGGLTPEVDPALLRELGYAIAIYPTTALLAATNAAVTALRGIGGSHAVPLPLSQLEDFFRLVGLDEWFAISEKWSGEPPPSAGSPDNAAGSSGAW